MNQLSSQQRKLIYLAAIGFLLIPIIILGRPATESKDSGGIMAKMRQEQDWGEDSLGDVDPSSSTMNLVLLGFRGIATSVLWSQAQEQSKEKEWGELQNTVESIVQLQPHYEKVWEFQGWNLAYNVSAEWDGVADRYYWVKRGGKFGIRGSIRNAHSPILFRFVGDRIYSNKIGKSDEWKQFREFFRYDPDKRYEETDGTDEKFDPGHVKDNYLVAKEWFRKANIVQKQNPKAKFGTDVTVLRADRARAQIQYAQAMHREGTFNETSRRAWEVAYQNWTSHFRDKDDLGYGKEIFTYGPFQIYQEAGEEDLKTLVKDNKLVEDEKSLKQIRGAVLSLQSMTNYRYWRDLTRAEKDPNTLAAHKLIFEGQELYHNGKFRQAATRLYKGMEKFEKMLFDYSHLKEGATLKGDSTKSNFQDYSISDDLTIEEALMAQIFWRQALDFSGQQVPDGNYPLKGIWEDDNHKSRIPELEKRIAREAALLLRKDRKRKRKSSNE